ncbi:hypothetical protein [Tautonia sociabilis]|uniref:Uncharacterized protein n=1 Tax=Tautonia sociabilis TaxID=2080755 RepID=A0A432MDE0_9BACT|nr:hypothetical protein [Tautonia sociabilis]RUL82206.1 hypothetical protein TsocGM_23760 [Tautonia sociabilis]
MAQNVFSLVRITGIVSVLLFAGAVGLGRLAPGPEGRTVGHGPLIGVSSFEPRPADGSLEVLDVTSGAIRTLELPDADRVDLAVGSPWVDAWDQAQIVGRWMDVSSDGFLRHTGLARVSYPSGRVLERIPLERYPISPPCWGSGTSDRVLYVSGDGALYRLDFDAPAGAPGEGGQPGLRRLPWRSEAGSPPYLLDVCRAGAGLEEEILLVSIVSWKRPGSADCGLESEIWWLRLDPDETEVVAAGPVTPTDPKGRDNRRRRPALGRRADGSLWLAYLSWAGTPDRMRLRVVPARVDERTGAPRVDIAEGTPLADGCLNSFPAFSEGGTRLSFVAASANGPISQSIALDDAPSPTALAAAIEPDRP